MSEASEHGRDYWQAYYLVVRAGNCVERTEYKAPDDVWAISAANDMMENWAARHNAVVPHVESAEEGAADLYAVCSTLAKHLSLIHI